VLRVRTVEEYQESPVMVNSGSKLTFDEIDLNRRRYSSNPSIRDEYGRIQQKSRLYFNSE
jgi:hypothetical protein